MDIHDPALTVTIALAAGITAQSIAIHLRVPGIVLLLAFGVLLGPDVAGVVQPASLGETLHTLVGLAVAIVLFEGGLSLSIERLRREAQTIRRLITLGAAVTAIGGAVAAKLIMGWDWRISILFGTLVIVTGPTVITPILRRIRVTRKLRTILEAEGVLIDPIGAIIAVVALEVAVAAGASSAAAELLGLPYRLGVGLVLGLIGGALIGFLLRYERVVPDGLENVFTLALVLALFEISEGIVAESGILAAPVAGMVVANMETRVKRELKEFKEQLTVLMVGLLFVLLAADVRVAQVVGLGWPAVATVAALMFVVRPLNVAACTVGSDLDLRDKAFMSWLAPRGIVAAAVASLFAQRLDAYGVPGGTELMELVFLVIAITVLVQGASGGWVAGLLGVRRPENRGWLLVGANAVGRALGRVLEEEGEEVVLIDTNASEARAAEEEGFRVVYGNANEDRTLLQADVEARRGFVAVTPNEGVNLLLARKARELYRVPRAFAALLHRRLGVQQEQVHEAGAVVLFGTAVDLGQWAHLFLHGSASVERWRLERDTGDADWSWAEEHRILPLVLVRGGAAMPVDDQRVPRVGDRAHIAIPSESVEGCRRWLREHGWSPVAGADADAARGAPGSGTEGRSGVGAGTSPAG